MIGTLLLFAAFVLVLVEIVQSRARNSLTTWAVLLVLLALLVPTLRGL